MTVNIHKCSLLIFFQSLFSGFNYFKNPCFNRPLFFNQSFSPTPKRRFNVTATAASPKETDFSVPTHEEQLIHSQPCQGHMQIVLIGAAAGCTAQGINTSCVHAAAPAPIPSTITGLDGKPRPCELSAALAGSCGRDAVLGMQLGQQQGSLSRRMCWKMCLGSPRANWHCPRVAVPGCSTLRFGLCFLSFHLDFILLSPTRGCYLYIFCN